MKIGINARFLTKPFTGIGQYTRYLFAALARQNPDVELIMVVPEAVPKSVLIDMPKNIQIKVLSEKLPGSLPGTGGMKKTFWEQVQVPKFFLKEKVDLVHFPYPANPWGVYAKQFHALNKPVFVTVHDTIPWTLPEYRRQFSTRLYQDHCKKAVIKADQILTVSQASKNELVELCEIPPEKTTVIHNATAPYYSQKIPFEQCQKILQKYGISDTPFFLYVGGFDDRKNVKMLVKVFKEQIAPHFAADLVLAGGKALNDSLYASFDDLAGGLVNKSDSGLTNAKNGASLKMQKGKIRVTGFIDEVDLPALYQSAFAFLNLSKKEGFNLPLLEAAVSGTPIITSDISVHHEVIGDNALFCPAEDEKQLGQLMKNLLIDPVFYQKQKQKIEDFCSPFSWEKSAEQLMHLYKKSL